MSGKCLLKMCWGISLLVCVGLIVCVFLTPFAKPTVTVMDHVPMLGLLGGIPAAVTSYKLIQGLRVGRKSDGFYYVALLLLCAGGVLFSIYGGCAWAGSTLPTTLLRPGAYLLMGGLGLYAFRFLGLLCSGRSLSLGNVHNSKFEVNYLGGKEQTRTVKQDRHFDATTGFTAREIINGEVDSNDRFTDGDGVVTQLYTNKTHEPAQKVGSVSFFGRQKAADVLKANKVSSKKQVPFKSKVDGDTAPSWFYETFGNGRRRLLENRPVRPLLARLQGQIASAVAADNKNE